MSEAVDCRRLVIIGQPYVEQEFVPVLQAQRDTNCARGLPSVAKLGVRDARVAIVGFGPSLQETWPILQTGRYDAIWTVSKSHDFLIERGIVPMYHTDTDFREHKAAYNTRFSPAVCYMLATQVHPFYLDRLTGFNVRLFHVWNGGTFDMRYFKQPVMFDAGLQAAHLAFDLGYREQEWFGMDADVRPDATHAGPHEGWREIEKDRPGERFTPMPVMINGQVRVMNQFLVRQALFCERMLRMTPRMRVTIHGDGALRPFLQQRGKCRVL